MALDILITTDRLTRDPIGRDFIDHVRGAAPRLNLNDAALYYDFPTYSDYETVVHKPDALLLSRHHGIIALRFVNGQEQGQISLSALAPIDESLGQFCSILIGRLLKSRTLRKDRSTLLFPVIPLVFITAHNAIQVPDLESEHVTSFGGFDNLLRERTIASLEDVVVAEARSVLEGAKALARPQRRIIEDPQVQTLAAALAKLEAEIANFDQRQRHAALVKIPGPQRIRGLAGSGKTVILAMKAAYLHILNPEAYILVTFYTRSLRTPIKNLITRFYRHYKDEDPNWDHVHIRHAWGGASTPGVYADASRRHGRSPVSFSTARQAAGPGGDPFDFICRQLLKIATLEPYYDHTLIDEGQDFPGGFYELCYALTKGGRDEKSIVWAYDELQNILDVTIRSPEQLFGTDIDGLPRVSLERSARAFSTNDTVLSKCYRNQREVLVTAHAVGFGIYREIVQLLESRDHWQDVGYEVLSGDFHVGDQVRICRPAENSPLSIDAAQAGKLILSHVAPHISDEINWIVGGVGDFLTGGLQPEDIMIVALDDRNARAYFKFISEALAQRGIATNNIISDPYNEPPFSLKGKVTLSTVYRAKGNEAAVVFALGIDAISPRTRSGRNRLFTAFTRTKAWLRVSGVGDPARAFCQEIDTALARFPNIEFVMPDLKKVELIQRDLSEKAVKAKRIRDEYVRRLRKEGFTEEEIPDLLSFEDRNAKQ